MANINKSINKTAINEWFLYGIDLHFIKSLWFMKLKFLVYEAQVVTFILFQLVTDYGIKHSYQTEF